MISSEVQRTLVKSPPELWAELSDPAALERHLGELGEIRITRAEPEKLVEWEAETARGTVAIKASGWGTKVTLTANREIGEPAGAEPGPDAAPAETEIPAALPVARAEPAPPETQPSADADAATEPDAEAGTEPAAAVSEPVAAEPPQPEARAPRMGFFARLFGRGRRRAQDLEAVPAAPIAESGAAETTSESPPQPSTLEGPDLSAALEPTVAPATPEDDESAPEAVHAEAVHAEGVAPAEGAEDGPIEPAEPPIDRAAQLQSAEEEVTAILTSVLDRLGAAHHRPFSRS